MSVEDGSNRAEPASVVREEESEKGAENEIISGH